MATTITASTRRHPLGNLFTQKCDFTCASGDTTASLKIPSFSTVKHIIIGTGAVKYTAAPTFSGNTVTLAFTVPTATAATLTKGGVTYTSAATSNTGNLITVAYTGGATAGAEVVTVVANAISVQIEDGVSSITQVRTAVNLSAPAALLVTATGTSATVVAVAAASHLSGGITGGTAGTILAIGN